jgi:thiamine biosynthesis lipoprotein
MPSCSPSRTLERARPLLGTTVSVRVTTDSSEAAAHQAIDAAFAAVARVHALMSFHEPGSDLSRIHRAPAGAWVEVDPSTAAVLHAALDFSERSGGAFDVTVGGDLVARGLLPMPTGSASAADADWRDIELDAGLSRVRRRRPVWIDLGGIAKGYAVDRAVESLREQGIEQGCINAGGDLRLLGEGPHRIAIDTGEDTPAHCPVLELGAVAVATSSGRGFATDSCGPHLHGRSRSSIGRCECVSVVAPQCMQADALTKIVLACGVACVPLLQALDATAYLQNANGEWSTLGAAA